MAGDRGEFAGALGTAAAFVVGFVPWIVYWILIGNTPFLTAVLVALALSLVVNLYAVVRRRPLMVLEVGTVAVFAVFVVLGLVLSDDTIERWIQPLGNLGLFLIVLISVLIGKPFTLQYAKQSTPPAQWNEPGFLYVCQFLAWVWVVAMGFMTVVAAIPPILDGDATVMDADDTLSIVCYWVLPYVALGVALLFTMKFPDWFVEAAGGDEPGPAAATTVAPAPAPVAASPATAHLRRRRGGDADRRSRRRAGRRHRGRACHRSADGRSGGHQCRDRGSVRTPVALAGNDAVDVRRHHRPGHGHAHVGHVDHRRPGRVRSGR